MGFVDKVRMAAKKFGEDHEAIEEERRKVKAQEREQLITGRVAEDRLAGLTKRSSESLSEAQRAIHAALESYLSELKARYLITADRIDDKDLAMLHDPLIKLGPHDFEALAEKHAGNPVMLWAVSASAEERGVYLTVPYFPEATRAAEATGFANGVIDACREVADGGSGLRLAMYQAGAVSVALAGE